MPDTDDDAARCTADALALQQSETRLRLMIDAVPAMMTYLDTEERFLFCNKPYLDLLGRTADGVVQRTLLEVFGATMHDRLAPSLRQVLAGGTARYERQHARPDGDMRDLSVTFVPHVDHDRVVGFFCLTLDVTEVKMLERRLAHLANHDALTGLANRTLYADQLSRAIEHNRRHGEPFALAFLDIDHFKDINDTHGHAVGDRLLNTFAQRLRATLRGVDIAARLGGDEFALILDGPLSTAHTAALGQKILDAVRLPFQFGDVTLRVTTSLGITIAHDASLTSATLEGLADAALYRAKARGRDACVLDD